MEISVCFPVTDKKNGLQNCNVRHERFFHWYAPLRWLEGFWANHIGANQKCHGRDQKGTFADRWALELSRRAVKGRFVFRKAKKKKERKAAVLTWVASLVWNQGKGSRRMMEATTPRPKVCAHHCTYRECISVSREQRPHNHSDYTCCTYSSSSSSRGFSAVQQPVNWLESGLYVLFFMIRTRPVFPHNSQNRVAANTRKLWYRILWALLINYGLRVDF